MKEAKKVYLDACSLCRPFDDQRYLRIRLETEAVNLILSKIKEGKYKMLVSPVHIKEIEAIENNFERIEILELLKKYGESINWNMQKTRQIAEDLIKKGLGVADAAHIAFAQQAGALFISCDDKLLKKCLKRLKNKISIWCGTPVTFCDKEGLK
jgi:predicted nucleic acid-binding protein